MTAPASTTTPGSAASTSPRTASTSSSTRPGPSSATNLCATRPRGGSCRRSCPAMAFSPTWINHSGGDTHWAVHITDAAVYLGGHQRWENNPNPSPGGDNDGPGAVSPSRHLRRRPLHRCRRSRGIRPGTVVVGSRRLLTPPITCSSAATRCSSTMSSASASPSCRRPAGSSTRPR